MNLLQAAAQDPEQQFNGLSIVENEQYRTFQAKYYNDPVGFADDCIKWAPGKGLTSYQREIMQMLVDKKRVSARGPRGLGKTMVSGVLILWYSLTRDGKDWKIPTTAGSWGQLTKYLWPEVRKWARLLRWDVIGREPFSLRTELLQTSLKLKSGEAFAISPDQPDLIEGAHADCLFFVFDESKAVKASTFDSVEGAFSNAGEETDAEAYSTAFSTPGEPNGRFYDIQSRQPGYEDWAVRAVTLQETMDAHIISKTWADRKKLQWGEEDQRYINHVLGNFASSDENGVIPLLWAEQAVERWYGWAGSILDRMGIEWKDYTDLTHKFKKVPHQEKGVLEKLGADIAGGGADQTVLGPLYRTEHGLVVDLLRYSSERDTMKTAESIAHILDTEGDANTTGVIDIIGIGSGPYNRLKQMGKNVVGFTASAKSNNKDHAGEFSFTNARSAAWWYLRELLDPNLGATLALPPDELLTGDLTSPHWHEAAGSKLAVEGKPEIRERIGRSTDSGDTVMMAVFVEQVQANNWAKLAREGLERKRAQQLAQKELDEAKQQAAEERESKLS